MSLKSILARWIPPALSRKKLDDAEVARVAARILQRSLIPEEAWRYWGYRRDAMVMAEDAFEKVGWVYGAVRAIARNVQQVPFYGVRTITGRGRGRIDRLPDSHALAQLLARPNPEEDFSGILESTAMNLSLRGESLWELEGVLTGENGKIRPSRIYVRPSAWIYKVDVANDQYQQFHLRVPTLGNWVIIPGDQAMFFKYTNPRDPWRGMAPMQAAYQAADTYYAAQIFNARFFESGAMPSLVLNIGKESGIEELTTTQRNRVRIELERLYSGLQNARRVAVTGPGETIEKLGIDIKDMDFAKLLAWEKQEILAVFGVPPIEVADVENANRANSSEQRRLFWEEIVVPLVQDIASLMNRKLAPRFGTNLFVQPDLAQVPALREDLKATSDGVLPWVKEGLMTINEAREDYLDLPPVPWGDEPYSMKIGPIGIEQAPPPAPAPKPNPDEPNPPATDPSSDAKKLSPAVGRRMLAEWKNAAISRVREGARTPLQAFPLHREARKATRKYGVPPEVAVELAQALHLELAVAWNVNAPELCVSDLFDQTLQHIPKGE